MRREKFHPSIHFQSLLIPCSQGGRPEDGASPRCLWVEAGLRATKRVTTTVRSTGSSWKRRKSGKERPLVGIEPATFIYRRALKLKDLKQLLHFLTLYAFKRLMSKFYEVLMKKFKKRFSLHVDRNCFQSALLSPDLSHWAGKCSKQNYIKNKNNWALRLKVVYLKVLD